MAVKSGHLTKTLSFRGVFLILLVLISGTSCKKECEISYSMTFYEPVYLDWAEIKADINSEPAREIHNPGKIFALGNYLFINEVNEGVHIIDNSDPANPQNIKFINIPGSLDIAASGSRLYSDNYSDLIVLDISDLDNVAEVGRVENVFFENSIGFWFDWSEDRVITAWQAIDTVYKYPCDQEIYYIDDALFDGGIIATDNGPLAFSESGGNDAVGKAGSMSRFALYNGKLYALNPYELKIFGISGNLNLDNSVAMEWGIETIFPYMQYLFIGARDGMHIMDISDAVHPEHISTYAHIRTCDPVIVADGLAWVTLRSGTECEGFTNQLDIIDLSDIYHPSLLTSYPMFNPHGLGAGGVHELLYICDGDDGLKAYDKTDPMDLQLVRHESGINAYDVIPYGNNLFMIGSDGFYQYDCSELDNIHLISSIPVVP